MPESPHPKDAEKVWGGLWVAYLDSGTPVTSQYLRDHGFRWDDGHVEACLDHLVTTGDAERRDDGYVPLEDGGVSESFGASDAYTARKDDLAGFDLYGTRLDDGRLELGHGPDGSGEVVDDWPESVTLDGDYHTYSLEFVRKQTDDGVVKLDVSEVQDADVNPGIEWGIYV